MNVIVGETDKFQAALAKVASTVSKSDSNPIQSAVKVWTKDSQLLVTVVDVNSHQITLGVDANVQVPGQVLIQADHFQKAMSRIGKFPLTFEQDGTMPLKVTCGEDVREFFLFGGEIEDFPMQAALPEQVGTINGTSLHNFSKGLLQGTLHKDQRMMFTTHADTTYLRGYSGDVNSGVIIRCQVQLSQKLDEFSFSVPFSAWRRMPHFTEDLTVHVGDDMVAFATGDQHFIIRSADTEAGAAASETDMFFDVPHQGFFITSLKQLREKVGALKVSKSTQVAHMTIQPDESIMVLSSIDRSRGTATNRLGIKDVSGQTPRLAFDCSFIDKAAAAIGSEELLFCYLVHKVEDEDDIWLVKIYDEQNPNMAQALILPVQE